MKKLFFAMLALVALASCSKDEVVQLNQDEIKFSVVAENTTKAANVYCANNPFSTFSVYAKYVNGTTTNTYINGDQISYENNSWTNKSATRYWPNDGKLSFYSVVNGTMTWNVNETNPAKVDFTVADEVKNQQDLLYAATSNKEKTTNAVNLNFRHALSQVVFKAKNTNKNLYVEIMGVGIHNLYKTNTLTLPTSTEGQIIDHNQDGTLEESTTLPANTTFGTWADFTTTAVKTTDYTVTFDAVKLPNADDVKNLTDVSEPKKDDENEGNIWENVMLLMPQVITSWDPNTDPDPDGTNSVAGSANSFFMVKCKMFNVLDANKTGDDLTAQNNLVQIWGGDNGSDVAIPVPAITWQQGKKYTYTFIFNDKTNGGYDPDPDGDTPEPVLVPITLDVTIDDFTKGEGIDVTTPPATTDSGSAGDGDGDDE